jgi:hypothetical protein
MTGFALSCRFRQLETFMKFECPNPGNNLVRQRPSRPANGGADAAGNKSLHQIGKQAKEAGALDCFCKLALLLVAHSGNAGRHDFAALGDVTL